METVLALIVLVIAVLGLTYCISLYPAIKQIHKNWTHPLTIDSLNHLELGTSLSPEELSLPESDIPKVVLFMTQDLGIKSVRLGLRWNQVEKRDGSISLSYYQPWIDALLENNCDIILNIGPIKTFRWPEEHIPDHITSTYNLPGKYRTVYSHLSIAQEALEYLDTLLIHIYKSYGKDIKTIQPENEPFNRFGAFAWLQDENYLHTVVERITQVLPSSHILLNTPLHPWGISSMSRFLKNSRFKEKFTLGLNYYYKNPYLNNIVTNTIFPKGFDAITASRLFLWNSSSLQRLDIPVMVSELQMEPWGGSTSPGNSEKELRFALTRVSELLQQSRLVLLWGFEHLYRHVKNATLEPEHEKMIDTIARINSTHAD